jgi:hypothetical protein
MKKEPKREFIGISCRPEIKADIVKAAVQFILVVFRADEYHAPVADGPV